MLRWMSGVTKLDRITNEINRGIAKVGKISKKCKRKWLDNIRSHLPERELPGDETRSRINWKRLMRNIDPHTMGKEYSFCSRGNSA